MWSLPTLCPWRPWKGQTQPEVAALAALRDQPHVAALIGSHRPDGRGRYGVVGIPCSVHVSPHETSVVREIFSASSPNRLRIIAMGYEAGFPLVHLPAQEPPRGQPKALCYELDAAIIVDHHTGQVGLFGEKGINSDILRSIVDKPPTHIQEVGRARLEPLVSDEEHTRRIRETREHIAAGDIYQANIARRLHIEGELNPLGMLEALTSDNPVPHGAYIRYGAIEVLSNTMETLLTFDPEERIVHSYPIKGTCERLESDGHHLGETQGLSQNPKERAEHVMIVDLVRNDLGRVCSPGSVRVPKLMDIEGYRGVWHGVSMVEGRLEPQFGPIEAIEALFPGGSITGAPKRRAMQIIHELERDARGFYTGSIGLITPTGRVSMSILIRTLVRDQQGWSLSVGGGIVTDSQPEREIQETWEKVRVFERILGNQGPLKQSPRWAQRGP